MQVRDLNFLDWPTLKLWQEQSGFEYPMPDPNQEAFAAMKLVVDGNRPVGAALARMTVEIYGFCDPAWGTRGGDEEAEDSHRPRLASSADREVVRTET